MQQTIIASARNRDKTNELFDLTC